MPPLIDTRREILRFEVLNLAKRKKKFWTSFTPALVVFFYFLYFLLSQIIIVSLALLKIIIITRLIARALCVWWVFFCWSSVIIFFFYKKNWINLFRKYGSFFFFFLFCWRETLDGPKLMWNNLFCPPIIAHFYFPLLVASYFSELDWHTRGNTWIWSFELLLLLPRLFFFWLSQITIAGLANSTGYVNGGLCWSNLD